MSEYTAHTIGGVETRAAYDNKGNLTTGLDGSTYVYDTQNRVISATRSGTTMYFTYDGLNRQVSHKTGPTGTPTFNVWDGWNLIEEYQSANSAATTAAYVYGATGLICGVTSGNFAYYYQDANGAYFSLAEAKTTYVIENELNSF